MCRCLAILLLALLSLVLDQEGRPAPLATERALASLVPQRCRVYLEARAPGPLLELGLDHPFLLELRALPLGRALLAALERTPEEALERADAWLGGPALRALAELTHRGFGLGFDPATKETVLVALGRDAAAVERHSTLALDAIERHLGFPGALDRPRELRSGADVWILGDACLARREALLVIGNDSRLVSETLALAADPKGLGLFERPGFAAHHAERPPDALVWAWLELAELERHADPGFRELRAANRTPAGQALLGARAAALLSARALSATLLRDGERGLALWLRAFEAPCAAALAPPGRDGDVPAAIGGQGLATALVYRDFSHYVSERARLFPPEALPGFAELLSNGALFFGGQDLGADVLPRLSPWIRLVSREAEFAADRRPELALPALAAVAALEDQDHGEEWVTAFQTIVSIANLDQAQKGKKGLRLHLEREGEVEISLARFPTPLPSDGVDLRYNLEPALAVVGRHLVLGTHASLVRELVRTLGASPPVPPSTTRETLELDAPGWRSTLERSFEHLVARKMLDEGLERGEAEAEIGGLRLALASIDGTRLELRGDDPAAPELRLGLRLARSEGQR
jgi:hypothetical protein